VAYLSLSRGEGGQNLIGPELGPELGIIRSEELLAARRIDGARQFFTRAYDFGYSKTLDEALRFWPRDSVLKDVLDIVRRFRPKSSCPCFPGRRATATASIRWRVWSRARRSRRCATRAGDGEAVSLALLRHRERHAAARRGRARPG